MDELFRSVKRSLRYKSPTDIDVEKMIIEKLDNLQVPNRDEYL